MIKYTSIDAILYDLSTTLSQFDIDETRMKEWAVKGLRKFNLPAKYTLKNCIIQVKDHKAEIPSDAKYITQIAYKENLSDVDLEILREIMNLNSEEDNPALVYIQDPNSLPKKALAAEFFHRTTWKPLRLTSNNFHLSINEDLSIYANKEYLPFYYDCPGCEHEYYIDENGCITTTLKNGLLYVAYQSAVTDDGEYLIPDDENLKDALFHFCLYRYYLMKPIDNQVQYEREFHLSQYEVLKTKATADINQPDEAQMENIKNMLQRLIPRSNRRDQFFSKLHNKENINF